MTRLLKLTAFYAGKLVNLTELGNKLGLDRLTIKKYMALLAHLFLVEQLPAWHSNEYKRLVKKPKISRVHKCSLVLQAGARIRKALFRRNHCHRRKIMSDPILVSRQQLKTRNCRMGANEKIRERSGLCPLLSSVL